MDKQQLKERETRVIELATAFCKEHLDDECAELCTKLVQKLGRKRSCPLQSGRVEIWAAASVYTICSINFMFSKSSRLNTSSAEIAEHFGASGSTIAQKSRVIKDLVKISNVFAPDFSLKEQAYLLEQRVFPVKFLLHHITGHIIDSHCLAIRSEI